MPRTRELKDKQVAALKPAEPGKRYDQADTEVRGLFVRVTDRGTKTFVLYTRFPGGSSPTRRALGEYPVLTLADAREKARQWKLLIKKGVDPRHQEERDRLAEQQKRDTTFAAVAEDFIADKLPNERAGKAVERDLRNVFIPALGRRPIGEIADIEIKKIIDAKKRSAPVQAKNLLALAKRFFNWAIDQRVYGVEVSPCARLKATKIIGETAPRDRILTEDELFALRRAADRLPYPHGPVYNLLILSALRLNEAAGAAWSEIDLEASIWTIPADRMKGRPSKAKAHIVPLTEEIRAIFESAPRFKGGEYVFTTTAGKSPAWIGDKIKKRVDARMLNTLKALARTRGQDPAAVTLPHWTNHDIRRTVRSGLSRLRVPEVASEAVLAHVRPGIIGTYDRHAYLDEKREALEAWASTLPA